jgi:hypothetical protein
MERMNIEQAKRFAIETLKLSVAAELAQRDLRDWLENTTPEERAEWEPFSLKIEAICAQNPDASVADMSVLLEVAMGEGFLPH